MSLTACLDIADAYRWSREMTMCSCASLAKRTRCSAFGSWMLGGPLDCSDARVRAIGCAREPLSRGKRMAAMRAMPSACPRPRYLRGPSEQRIGGSERRQRSLSLSARSGRPVLWKASLSCPVRLQLICLSLSWSEYFRCNITAEGLLFTSLFHVLLSHRLSRFHLRPRLPPRTLPPRL